MYPRPQLPSPLRVPLQKLPQRIRRGRAGVRGVVGLVEVALRTLRARPRPSRPEVLAEVVVPRHGSPADVAHREAATASHLVAPVLLAELQAALRAGAHGRPVDGERDVRAQGLLTPVVRDVLEAAALVRLHAAALAAQDRAGRAAAALPVGGALLRREVEPHLPLAAEP